MKIIAEAENTIQGNVVVVKNESGTFSVGLLNDNDEFDPKHPDLNNTESVINALMHYLNAEAYKRAKLEKELISLK